MANRKPSMTSNIPRSSSYTLGNTKVRGPPSPSTQHPPTPGGATSPLPHGVTMFEATQSMPLDAAKGGYVQISATDYELIQAQLANSHRQVQHTKNLMQIIEEKEEDITRMRERCYQFERALRTTELKLGQLIRFQLEESKKTSPSKSGLKSGLTSIRQAGVSGDEATEEGTTDEATDVMSIIECTPSTDFNATMVSRKTFDKLNQDYKKLRKVLEKEAQKSKFGNVTNFLNAQETDQVIFDLREDLRQAKKRESELETIFTNSSDPQFLASKCGELQMKVQKLEEHLKTKTKLLETYSKALEEESESRKSLPSGKHHETKDVEISLRQRDDDLRKKDKEIEELKSRLSELSSSLEKVKKDKEDSEASLSRQINSMKNQLSKKEEKVESLQRQVEEAHNDLKVEKVNVQKRNADHEKSMRQHQVVLRRQYEEIKRLTTFEQLYQSVIQQEVGKKKSLMLPKPCSTEVSGTQLDIPGMHSMVMDGPDSDEITGGARPKTSLSSSVKLWTCKHCWREFSDRGKYEEHVKKCDVDEDDDDD